MRLNVANNNGSVSVIIPKKALEQLQWAHGDTVKMSIEEIDEVKSLVIQKTDESEFI